MRNPIAALIFDGKYPLTRENSLLILQAFRSDTLSLREVARLTALRT
jgi:hypothetical protein